jgi:hypothetical protein
MLTEDIVRVLNNLDEAPWAEVSKGKPLNALALAQRLRQYGVSSKNIRQEDRVSKGYAAEDLVDAWSRYLPPVSPQKAATSATDEPSPPGQGVADDEDGAATAATDVDPEATDDDADICGTCGVNPVEMIGLDCDECMGVSD